MTTRRPLLATAVLAGVAIGAAMSLPPAVAAFPGANGRIAYARLSGTASDVFTVLPGGASRTQLTTTADASDPAWAPAGGRIVFTRTDPDTLDSDLWLMRADGTSKTRITSGASVDQDPSWAPDSRRIVFSSNRSGSIQLHVLDLTNPTTAPRRITSVGTTPAFAFDPSWSPDGTLIAFSRSSSTGVDLYTIHPNGTGLHRVTATPGLDEDAPNWAPGGGRLVYTRHARSDGLICTHAVFTINRDGTGARKIFDTACEDWQAAWSPNGRRIVLHSDGPADATGGHPRSGIWTVNPDGTSRAFLTSTVNGALPDWQPVP
jgi:TolB protein